MVQIDLDSLKTHNWADMQALIRRRRRIRMTNGCVCSTTQLRVAPRSEASLWPLPTFHCHIVCRREDPWKMIRRCRLIVRCFDREQHHTNYTCQHHLTLEPGFPLPNENGQTPSTRQLCPALRDVASRWAQSPSALEFSQTKCVRSVGYRDCQWAEVEVAEKPDLDSARSRVTSYQLRSYASKIHWASIFDSMRWHLFPSPIASALPQKHCVDETTEHAAPRKCNLNARLGRTLQPAPTSAPARRFISPVIQTSQLHAVNGQPVRVGDLLFGGALS